MKTFLLTCLKYYTHPLVLKIVSYQAVGVAAILAVAMIVFAFIYGPATEPIKYLYSLAFFEGALLASWIVAVPLAILTYIFLIKEKDEEQL